MEVRECREQERETWKGLAMRRDVTGRDEQEVRVQRRQYCETQAAHSIRTECSLNVVCLHVRISFRKSPYNQQQDIPHTRSAF